LTARTAQIGKAAPRVAIDDAGNAAALQPTKGSSGLAADGEQDEKAEQGTQQRETSHEQHWHWDHRIRAAQSSHRGLTI
jgi:hypothetical protein